jgi:hypothetical protein
VLYQFEDFELREEDFCLNRAGQRISLEPKSLRGGAVVCDCRILVALPISQSAPSLIPSHR